MKKHIFVILALLLAVAFGAFSVYEFFQIKGLKNELREEVDGRKEERLNAKRENDELNRQKASLTHQQSITRDSMRLLDIEIRKLKKKIRQQRSMIEGLQTAMTQKEAALDSILVLLRDARNDSQSSRQRIAELEASKSNLSNDLGNLKTQNDTLRNEKDRLVDKMLDREDIEQEYKNRFNVINNTYVLFQVLKLTEKKNGKALKNRVKKQRNNWNYTHMTFNLDHETETLLLGEEFVLRIVDKDSGKPLSLREQNPLYPDDNDASSLPFVFEKNPIELTHFNSQKKLSDNYEIQLFYKVGKEEFLLKNGTQLIVSKRKPLNQSE